MLNPYEILETIRMIDVQHLDIRTITMGISLRDCADGSAAKRGTPAHLRQDHAHAPKSDWSKSARRSRSSLASPSSISASPVTPISFVAAASCAGAASGGDVSRDTWPFARTLDEAAAQGRRRQFHRRLLSALVHKGFTVGDRHLIETQWPEALAATERAFCASVNVATTQAAASTWTRCAQMGVGDQARRRA